MILPNLIKIISIPTAGYDMGWGVDTEEMMGVSLQRECDRFYSFDSWYAHTTYQQHILSTQSIKTAY